MTPMFDPIADPATLAELATGAIRSRIASGRLRPGARLIETQLASELGVSRPPVREALRVLEQEGLVVSLPRRGVTVTELSPQDVYEIYTLRRTLEEMAVRIGVPVLVPERLARVEAAFETLLEHARQGDEESAAEDSHRFHLAIIGLAGHGHLERVYRSLALQLTMYLNRQARAAHETLLERAERHRSTLELVRAGDAEALLTDLGDLAAVSLVTRLGVEPAMSAEARAWYAAIAAAKGS
jgi:DNA-binding GntR family transcriptional regulator